MSTLCGFGTIEGTNTTYWYGTVGLGAIQFSKFPILNLNLNHNQDLFTGPNPKSGLTVSIYCTVQYSKLNSINRISLLRLRYPQKSYPRSFIASRSLSSFFSLINPLYRAQFRTQSHQTTNKPFSLRETAYEPKTTLTVNLKLDKLLVCYWKCAAGELESNKRRGKASNLHSLVRSTTSVH